MAEAKPSEQKPFTFHVAETRHYEFQVWGIDEADVQERGQQIWREAATTGQWELPDEETEYRVTDENGLSKGTGT